MVDRLAETGQIYFEIKGDSFVDLGNVGTNRAFWPWRNAVIGASSGFLIAAGLGWSFEPLSQLASFAVVGAIMGGSTRSWSFRSFRERMFLSSSQLVTPSGSKLATYWMR